MQQVARALASIVQNQVKNVNIWKLCENATNTLTTLSILQFHIEQELFTSDVGAASLEKSPSIDIDSDVFFDSAKFEERTQYLFESAELLLLVQRHEIRKLAEVWLQFLSWPNLTSEVENSALRKIKTCSDIVVERVTEKCSGIHMVALNMLITSSDWIAENYTIILRNTKDMKRKQLALARDDEVVCQLFVEENTPKRPLDWKLCENF